MTLFKPRSALARRNKVNPPSTSERYSLEQYVQQASFAYGGTQYGLGMGNSPYQTTYAKNPAESIPTSFVGYSYTFASNPVVFGLIHLRMDIFAEARFIWQQLRNGRPGDLFSGPELDLFNNPFPGGSTGDFLSRLLEDADLAGNAYWANVGADLIRLRPDWVDIVLEPRIVEASGRKMQVGWRRIGYGYYEGGDRARDPFVFLADEVMHFAPIPDPLATYRGMSWLTPVVREIQADDQAMRHKQAWWENAATPNLAVSLKIMDPDEFEKYAKIMERLHAGPDNAGKTLYVGAGADVTVIGKDMKEVDFSSVVGAGETRLAFASGIHPVVAGLSEGLQGSSLNVGNYAAAKTQTGDRTFRPLWRNAAGSAQVLMPPKPGARLWIDTRDVPFLRDDIKDVASVQQQEATTIRALVDAGYTPESVVSAVMSNDWRGLVHSGLYSVQLQAAGSADPAALPASA